MVSDIYSVTNVTRLIKDLIDANETLRDLVVEGEVSNATRAQSGHCYFTLKDSESEIHCVMWRGIAQRFGYPEHGMHIHVRGYVSVYERGGKYQLYVNEWRHVGDGLLWQQFLDLKEKLDAEGLFDESLKQSLPRWPRIIGIVSSPTAAGFQDMLKVLRARFPLVSVVLAPTLVQGSDAPAGIVRAIHRLEQEPDIDVILLGRGGGSLEDLWAFNDEDVARAISACPIPVVTGIGHQTDFTIADFCADVWAPTPTAAAAAAVPDVAEIQETLSAMEDRLIELTTGLIDASQHELEIEERLLERYSPERQMAEHRQRLDDLVRRMIRAVGQVHSTKQLAIEAAIARLEALDPRLVLARGYAVVRDRETGTILHSVTDTNVGRDVDVQLHEGNLIARVARVFTEK